VKIKTFKTIKFPAVLYLGVKLGLSPCGTTDCVFENRVLRVIFGVNSNTVTGGWRKQSSEERHVLY
jgi:hypothetical protein